MRGVEAGRPRDVLAAGWNLPRQAAMRGEVGENVDERVRSEVYGRATGELRGRGRIRGRILLTFWIRLTFRIGGMMMMEVVKWVGCG